MAKLTIMTAAEMSKQYDEQRRRLMANPKWGSWYLDRGTFELVNKKRGYPIDLDDCTDSAQILDWIYQVFQKGWSKGEMEDLLRAFRDILNPQKNFCSLGKNHERKPRVVAKEWLKPKRSK